MNITHKKIRVILKSVLIRDSNIFVYAQNPLTLPTQDDVFEGEVFFKSSQHVYSIIKKSILIWKYITTQALPALSGSKIVVTAIDRPGNQTVEEKVVT